MSRNLISGSPFMLGFDHVERLLDHVGRNADGYPPYNIEKLDENNFRITLAVAGFARENIDMELNNNELTIIGKSVEEEKSQSHEFIHRGIASRQFKRSFVLADGIEISSAKLDNGMLYVNLVRNIPDKITKKINIE